MGPPAPIGQYSNFAPSLLYQGQTQVIEYLVLVNGQDDNKNGWIDEVDSDGVDNNGINGPDDPPAEFCLGAGILAGFGLSTSHLPARHPLHDPPPPGAIPGCQGGVAAHVDGRRRHLRSPSTQERSRLPVNPFTGYVDIILNPDGTVVPTVQYSSPSSFGMAGAFYHFWLSERQDLMDLQPNSNGTAAQPLVTGAPYSLPIAQPGGSGSGTYPGPYLKGEYSVLSLSTRTGQIVVNQSVPFLYSSSIGYNSQTGTYNPTNPFIQAEQGLSGGGR